MNGLDVFRGIFKKLCEARGISRSPAALGQLAQEGMRPPASLQYASLTRIQISGIPPFVFSPQFKALMPRTFSIYPIDSGKNLFRNLLRLSSSLLSNNPNPTTLGQASDLSEKKLS